MVDLIKIILNRLTGYDFWVVVIFFLISLAGWYYLSKTKKEERQAVGRQILFTSVTTLICILVIIFHHVISATWYLSPNSPRLKIKIIKYEGEQQSIQRILHTKLINLADELQSKGEDFTYLENLQLDPVLNGLSSGYSLKDLSIYWKKSHALEVLSGVVYVKDELPYVVSNIYFGDLADNLNKKMITVEMKLVPEEWKTLNDSHSLVTLFSLAMDAKRTQKPRGVISEYLSSALNIANDLIKDDHGKRLEEIRLLKVEIVKELNNI